MRYSGELTSRWLLRGATLIHLMPPRVERKDIRIQGSFIYQIGENLPPLPDEAILDLSGQWIMPGFISAHTHLNTALSLGMPISSIPPLSFSQLMRGIWWRFEDLLDEEAIRISALLGGLQALQAGVTTIVDHHSSPNAIEDSLIIIDQALEQLGLRRILAYSITDRKGPEDVHLGFRAHEKLLASELAPQSAGMRAVMLGAHANYTLSDETLRLCADFARQHALSLHIHVAEAIDDAQITGENPVKRLKRLGALLPGSLLAHCVHVSKEDISLIQKAGAWISHQPRSNMNEAVGYAPVKYFGYNTLLGVDNLDIDILSEIKVAWLRSREAHLPWTPERWLQVLAATASFASEKLGITLGQLAPQSAADLIVLEPLPFPPLDNTNLTKALLLRFSSSQIRHVMIHGTWRLWEREPLTLDLPTLTQNAHKISQDIWKKMNL